MPIEHIDNHVIGNQSLISLGGTPHGRAVPPGPVEPCFGSYFLTYDQNQGFLNGRINAPNGEFSVLAIGNNRVAITEFESFGTENGSECGECPEEGECAFASRTGFPNSSEEEFQKQELISENLFITDRTICYIDVLAVATPQVANLSGYASSDALSAIHDMNVALRNSGIENVIYHLVGYENLTTFSFTNGSQPKVTTQAADNNNEIANLRASYGADQVLVFYQSGGLAGVRGNSELYDAPDTRNTVLAEVGTSARFTPVHELAHNHGCKHRYGDDTVGGPGQLSPTARGARIDKDDFHERVEISIMSINARDISETEDSFRIDGTRILQFSNPAVVWHDSFDDADWVTGTTTRNNAAQMAATACLIAGFEERVPEGLDLDGPFSAFAGTFVRINADRRCRNNFSGQVSYFVSLDGGPFTLAYTGGTTFTYDIPASTTVSVQVKAVTYCSNSQQYVDIHRIDIKKDPCDNSFLPEMGRGSISDLDKKELFYSLKRIDQSSLNLILDQDFSGEILISDISGRILARKKVVSVANQQTFIQLNSNLSSQFVFLTLTNSSSTKTSIIHVE